MSLAVGYYRRYIPLPPLRPCAMCGREQRIRLSETVCDGCLTASLRYTDALTPYFAAARQPIHCVAHAGDRRWTKRPDLSIYDGEGDA